MLQNALKVGLIALVVGLGVQSADAFWGCGRGCGWGGCGWGAGCYYGGYYGGYCGYGYAGCGYVGVGYYGPACYGGGYGAPAAPAAPANGAQPPKSARVDASSVLLAVDVPADAKVFINGQPTTSTGERREYKSNNLKAAETYAYRVRAEFVRDGKPVSEEQVVQLTAGQIGAFTFAGATGAEVANVSLTSPR
jgi:uncharacterized protein (TIGR03000 family)